MKLYQVVSGGTKALYCLVLFHSGVGDFPVLPPTVMLPVRKQSGKSCVIGYSMYWYVLVCTSTYQYVPEHTKTFMNVLVPPVHAHTYQYIHVCTNTCLYIPVHTSIYLGSKKMQRGLEPTILCMIQTNITPARKRAETDYRVCQQQVFVCIYADDHIPAYVPGS